MQLLLYHYVSNMMDCSFFYLIHQASFKRCKSSIHLGVDYLVHDLTNVISKSHHREGNSGGPTFLRVTVIVVHWIRGKAETPENLEVLASSDG